MVYKTVLSVRAKKEIEASWVWYEERQQGLGDRFLKATILRLQQIEQTPERYPVRYKKLQRNKY